MSRYDVVLWACEDVLEPGYAEPVAGIIDRFLGGELTQAEAEMALKVGFGIPVEDFFHLLTVVRDYQTQE